MDIVLRMEDVIWSLLADYTFQTVAMGCLLLGLLSGLVGSFVVLRKQGLLGDGISHATMPGLALVYLLMETQHQELLLLGAAGAGLLAMLLILQITRHCPLPFDAALAVVFSSFFGLGMVLLTFIQRLSHSSQAGLDRFIFGQAATMLRGDLFFMACCAAFVILLAFFFWKEIQLFLFDRDFAESMGYSMGWVQVLLSVMVVVVLIVGLQTVGVILMCAMLICPAVAARQWTQRLMPMVVLSCCVAVLAGIAGTAMSSLVSRMPTGPCIVVCLSGLVLMSILFAPQRGLIHRMYIRRRNRSRFARKELEDVIRG